MAMINQMSECDVVFTLMSHSLVNSVSTLFERFQVISFFVNEMSTWLCSYSYNVF